MHLKVTIDDSIPGMLPDILESWSAMGDQRCAAELGTTCPLSRLCRVVAINAMTMRCHRRVHDMIDT